jgi:hypothetical protein
MEMIDRDVREGESLEREYKFKKMQIMMDNMNFFNFFAQLHTFFINLR